MTRLSIFSILAALCIVSCGSSINDAQTFVPNDPPEIQEITKTYYNPAGLAFDENALISHMTFDIAVAATDPEGQPLTYTFTSDHGSFSDQTDSAAGSTVKFLTGKLKAGDKVAVTLTLTDTKRGATVKELPIGTGKPVPVTASVSALSFSLSINTAGSVTAKADCDGFFQLVESDSLTSSTAHFDGEKNSFVLADKNSSCDLPVPAFTTTGPHKVWVLFQDYIGQDAKPLEYTVEVN